MFERVAFGICEQNIDLSQAYFVMLDEWRGTGMEHKGSCIRYLNDNLFSKVAWPEENVFLIDGMASDMKKVCDGLNEFIALRGPLSLSVLGIGMNGHLGFNEGGCDFGAKAHVTDLDPLTDAAITRYFGEYVPIKQGITQGIAQIMDAREVLLLASGKRKADIVKKALEGPVTDSVPASVLQRHANCTAVLDIEAAGLISHG